MRSLTLSVVTEKSGFYSCLVSFFCWWLLFVSLFAFFIAAGFLALLGSLYLSRMLLSSSGVLIWCSYFSQVVIFHGISLFLHLFWKKVLEGILIWVGFFFFFNFRFWHISLQAFLTFKVCVEKFPVVLIYLPLYCDFFVLAFCDNF